MAYRAPAEPSQRQLRVGEEIRHALSEILARETFRDPDLQDVSVTVTEVRPAPDLRVATAFVTPLGGGDIERTVAALNRASGFVRGKLGRMVHLKFLPSLQFEADRSFDAATRVDTLLSDPRVARDLDGPGDADPGAGRGPGPDGDPGDGKDA